MTELVRNCAGGIVFRENKVFLLMNDRSEWVMPKGVIRDSNRSNEVALWRVEDEAGIQAEIIGIAGNTHYRFFSETRQCYVINRIQWFVMRAESDAMEIAREQGFQDGRYCTMKEALQIISHDENREMLKIAWEIYQRQK